MRVFHFPGQETPISLWPDRLVAVGPKVREQLSWIVFVLIFATPGLSGLAQNAFFSFLMLAPIGVFFLFFFLAMKRLGGTFKSEMILPGFDDFFQNLAKRHPGYEEFSVDVQSDLYVKGHILEIVTIHIHAKFNGVSEPMNNLTKNDQRKIKRFLKQNPLKCNLRIVTVPAKGSAHQILQQRNGLIKPEVRACSVPHWSRK